MDTQAPPLGLQELVVTDVLVRKPRKERLATTLGSLTAGSKVAFHNSSYRNIVRALEERVFRVKQGDQFVCPPRS